MTDQATQLDQNENLHITPQEARKQRYRADVGGRVPQDVAIAALKEVEGLRYEYAAQIWRPLLNKWLFIGPSNLHDLPSRARWYVLPTTAKTIATEKYPHGQVRIVMRAHSQPVPVEENTNA